MRVTNDILMLQAYILILNQSSVSVFQEFLNYAYLVSSQCAKKSHRKLDQDSVIAVSIIQIDKISLANSEHCCTNKNVCNFPDCFVERQVLIWMGYSIRLFIYRLGKISTFVVHNQCYIRNVTHIYRFYTDAFQGIIPYERVLIN